MTDLRPPFSVHRCVTYVHAADVGASVAFYAGLGFAAVNTMRDPAGRAFLAMAWSGDVGGDVGGGGGGCGCGGAEIMFARASGRSIRQSRRCFSICTVRMCGLHDGGVFTGQPGLNGGRRVVFALAARDYMPGGRGAGDGSGRILCAGRTDGVRESRDFGGP